MKKYFILTFFVLSFIFISCEQEINRIDLINNPSVSIDINCEKDKPIDFYLDCDIEFEQTPNMVMDFEFYKGKNQLLKGGLDPLAANPKEKEIKTAKDKITHWQFYGKLEGNFMPPEDTIFTIKPTLIKNKHPNLKLNKFDLVFVAN